MINKTILKNDLKNSKKQLIIWVSVLCGIVFLFMMLFILVNSMKEKFYASPHTSGMGQLFDPAGYFAAQVGNNILLGLIFFSCWVAVSAWAREEREKTAEFLLQLPVSRKSLFSSRQLSMLIKILILNVSIWITSFASIYIVSGITGIFTNAKNILALFVFFACVLAMCLIVSQIVFFLSVRSKKVYTTMTGTAIGFIIYIAGTLVLLLLSDLVLPKKWQEVFAFLRLASVSSFTDAAMFVDTIGAFSSGDKVPLWWGLGALGVWAILGILAFVFSGKYFIKRDLKS